jgi:hypothetical protein
MATRIRCQYMDTDKPSHGADIAVTLSGLDGTRHHVDGQRRGENKKASTSQGKLQLRRFSTHCTAFPSLVRDAKNILTLYSHAIDVLTIIYHCRVLVLGVPRLLQSFNVSIIMRVQSSSNMAHW